MFFVFLCRWAPASAPRGNEDRDQRRQRRLPACELRRGHNSCCGQGATSSTTECFLLEATHESPIAARNGNRVDSLKPILPLMSTIIPQISPVTPLLARLIRSYLRSTLRGNTRLTLTLARQVPRLRAVPITINGDQQVY